MNAHPTELCCGTQGEVSGFDEKEPELSTRFCGWSDFRRQRLGSEESIVPRMGEDITAKLLFAGYTVEKSPWVLLALEEGTCCHLLADGKSAQEDAETTVPLTQSPLQESPRSFSFPLISLSKQPHAENVSAFTQSSAASARTRCRSMRAAEEGATSRINAKIKKVKAFWNRTSQQIPNVFVMRQALPKDEMYLLEQYDLSHKEVQASAEVREGGLPIPSPTQAFYSVSEEDLGEVFA